MTIRCGPAPGMLKATVSAPALFAAAASACRKVQVAPQLEPLVSAVEVTVKVAAWLSAAINASNSKMRIGRLPGQVLPA